VLIENLRLIRLSRRSEPFDSDEHIFELKIDGFRAVAHIEPGEAQLISRNGNVFRLFADLATWIAEYLGVESAVLHGEIACVDETGHVQYFAICCSAVVSASSSLLIKNPTYSQLEGREELFERV
jgi:ATP-dependent DNA ligase